MHRSVGSRCRIAPFALPAGSLDLLAQKGFVAVEVDVVAEARSNIGLSSYRRGASIASAPGLVDCSGFTKYLYGLLGIWIPRLAVQQFAFGTPVDQTDLRAGDLLFTAHRRYHQQSSTDPIGHVGLATGEGTVIHASRPGVTEVSVGEFIRDDQGFCGACRIMGEGELTLQIPDDIEVETSDDLYWMAIRSR